MKKNYTIIQDGIKECGSACLLSIIRYYGGNISLERILELTKTSKIGTNFYNLYLAANEIGLNAKGYKLASISDLYKLNKPFISQVVINNYYEVPKTKSLTITRDKTINTLTLITCKDKDKQVIYISYLINKEEY